MNMSELSSQAAPELSVATWNIADTNQSQRIGQIAEFLASRPPGITILTELVEVNALSRALVAELGQDFELESVATRSPYGDTVGLLVTGDSRIEEVEPVNTGGKKMPSFMRAVVSTPLGGATIAAMRGAYVTAKGGWLTSGSRERKHQYRTAIDVLDDALASELDITLIGGDMNSFETTHDPIFAAAAYTRLTGWHPTWPDKEGIRQTNRKAQVIAAPFIALGRSFSIDAIYGRGPVQSVDSEAVATGLSDHLYLSAQLEPIAA